MKLGKISQDTMLKTSKPIRVKVKESVFGSWSQEKILTEAMVLRFIVITRRFESGWRMKYQEATTPRRPSSSRSISTDPSCTTGANSIYDATCCYLDSTGRLRDTGTNRDIFELVVTNFSWVILKTSLFIWPMTPYRSIPTSMANMKMVISSVTTTSKNISITTRRTLISLMKYYPNSNV